VFPDSRDDTLRTLLVRESELFAGGGSTTGVRIHVGKPAELAVWRHSDMPDGCGQAARARSCSCFWAPFHSNVTVGTHTHLIGFHRPTSRNQFVRVLDAAGIKLVGPALSAIRLYSVGLLL